MINQKIIYRIFQLNYQYKNELTEIINLNDNSESLKILNESYKIKLHDTIELKEELKQIG